MERSILVVEDEQFLRSDLVSYFQVKGYNALGVSSVADGAVLIERQMFSAVILDSDLPDGDGGDLIPRIRECQGLHPAIIVVAASHDPEYRIAALDSGADAYLVKRASLREVEATLRSVIRRRGAAAAVKAQPGGWQLDRRAWALTDPHGRVIQLTSKEMTLLGSLAEHQGKVCARAALAANLTGKADSRDRNLDVVILRLRRKIEKATGDAAPIRIAYGLGYAFAAPLAVADAARDGGNAGA